MIEQELLFLGLLKESPKHGYEIKLRIKEIPSLFAGVDLKSIYYPLAILEKKGLVSKRIDKLSRRPQRYVYKLTPKGEKRFEELLTGSLLSFKRPQFSLDLSLYFLHHIKPDIAKRRLRGRMRILNNLSKSLQRTAVSLSGKKSPPLINILEHDRQMVEAESRFLKSFISSV